MNGFKLIIFKMNNKNMFLVTIQVCVCVLPSECFFLVWYASAAATLKLMSQCLQR